MMARYKTLGMLADELNADAFSYQIAYMNDFERAQCIISVRGGRVIDHLGVVMTGDFISLDLADNVYRPMRTTCLYVMDGEGIIYCAPGVVVDHHSCFLAGRPVAAAGLISFDSDGYIESISPSSGHYQPPRDYFEQVIRELKRRGATFKKNAIQSDGHGQTSFDMILENQFRRHERVTDYSQSAPDVPIGSHKQGQYRRLYPSGPKWQWF